MKKQDRPIRVIALADLYSIKRNEYYRTGEEIPPDALLNLEEAEALGLVRVERGEFSEEVENAGYGDYDE